MISENGRSPVDPPDIIFTPIKMINAQSKSKEKRAGGIEPPSSGWKPDVLPLNYARRYDFIIIESLLKSNSIINFLILNQEILLIPLLYPLIQ